MGKGLTARALATLKPGRQYSGKRLEERSEVPDGNGLYVVVGSDGPRSWVFRYRRPHNGAVAKLTLGRCYMGDDSPAPVLGGLLTLAGARRLALDAKVALGAGRDPGREKKAAKDERRDHAKDTFGAVLTDYYETVVPLKKRNRTAPESRKLLEKDCKDWMELPIRSITRRDVRDLLNKIVRRGSPIMANNVRAMLGPVFKWAWKQERITENVIEAVDRPAEHQDRDRVLTDGELVELWRAAETLDDPWPRLARVLILTGARRDMVASMKWDHLKLDGDAPEWHVPAAVMKMGRDFIVPLAPSVAAILKEQREAQCQRLEDPRIAEQRQKRKRPPYPKSVPFVFWAGRFTKDGAVEGPDLGSRFRNAWRDAVNEGREEPMPHWVPHDLRRSLATGLAARGIDLIVTELLLDHRPRSLKGVAKVYQRHDFLAERRHALNVWAQHVTGLIEGRQTSNVVQLKGA